MRFDVIIKNGNIIDGTGNPYYRGDVGIHNGRIEKIGFLKNEQAEEIIDADDLVVCPGFIDVHSHSDAVKEVIEITQASGCRGGHIAHHKVSGRAYWGKAAKRLS
jgi:N-acyl-D-aspartate/D-glutamate deacylase